MVAQQLPKGVRVSQLQCVLDSYNKYFGPQANTVIEIGSRDGKDAYFLSHETGAKNVYTFEANPRCHEVIKKSYPEFKNICAAVSNFSGMADFNAVESENWDIVGTSSLRDRNDSWYNNKANKITVSVDTMHNYIIKNKIEPPFDIVKIDVEGCSHEVLEGFGKFILGVKAFHIENETTAFWKDQKLAEDVAILLMSYGFIKDYEEKFGESSVDEVWINGNLI
jgi:FkbM family methyltransferase